MSRVFLDWCEPILKSASHYIVQKYKNNDILDLREVSIVTAGSKPQKRLVELLLLECERENISFIPPRSVTPKSLIFELITSSKKLLTEFQSFLFFIKALQNKKELVEKEFLKKDYQKSNLSSYISLSRTIYSLYEEISVANISFEDISKKAIELDIFNDGARWEFLQEIYEEYKNLLKEYNASDIFIERQDFLKFPNNIDDTKDLIFVNVPYLNPIFRDILNNIECRKTFLIFAPENKKEYFDELGTLNFPKWLKESVDIDDDNIFIANNAVSLGNIVKDTLIDLSKNYSAKDIIVAVTDDSLILPIKKEVLKSGINIVSVREKKLSSSSLYKFIDLLKNYVDVPTYENFSNLVRHSDILDYLILKDDTLTTDIILSSLDEYAILHFPYYFKKELIIKNESNVKDKNTIENIKKIFNIIEQFFKMNDNEASIGIFLDFILNIIVEIYQNLELSKSNNEDKVLIEVFESYRKIIISLSEKIEGFEINFSFSQVLSLLNSLVLDINIGAISYDETVEIQGWLEVQNDDSSVAILLGLSEGKWPESISQDEFLPNSLRKILGLMDNDKRYVRDLFMLKSIIASRDKVYFVPLKTNLDSSENLMSKLLLTSDSKTNAKRILKFYDAENYFDEDIENKNNDISFLLEPKITSYNLERISVSQFKQYHACPYRYYLKYILKLDSIDSLQNELDPLAYGNLFHELFYRFGISKIKDSEDKNEIDNFLLKELSKYIDENFGKDYLPTIDVQLEGVKNMLFNFSSWQSCRKSRGWVIKEVEKSFDDFYMNVNGKNIKITGRIDRIDYNEKEDRYIIYDYKTGSSKYDESAVYGPRKGWTDWQMPIYLYFLSMKDNLKNVTCAYLNSSSFSNNDYLGDEVNINDESLEEALVSVKEIISNIQNAVFWPPKNINSPYDIFKDLCP